MDSDPIIPYRETLPKKPEHVIIFCLVDGIMQLIDISTLYFDEPRVRQAQPDLRERSNYVNVKLVEKNIKPRARLFRPIEISPSHQICYLSVYIEKNEEANLLCAGQLMRMTGANVLLQIQAFLMDSDETLSVLLVDGKKHVSEFTSLSLNL